MAETALSIGDYITVAIYISLVLGAGFYVSYIMIIFIQISEETFAIIIIPIHINCALFAAFNKFGRL